MLFIPELMELAKDNPLLVGGIGTVLFTSAMFLLKGVPYWIYKTIKRVMTIEVSLTSNSYLYNDILDSISGYRVPLLTRNFTTNEKGDLVAGFGSSFAWYKGKFVIFSRSLVEKSFNLQEQVNMTLFTRNVNVALALVNESRYKPTSDKVKIYPSCNTHWGGSTKKKKRSLDTVFVGRTTKETILGAIDWFYDNEKWYLERGIPYKATFLFSGPPGTGKTSLIYALASHYNKNLCVVREITNIDSLLAYVPSGSFVVIEDIDMLTISRDDDVSQDEPQPAGGGIPVVGQQQDASFAKRGALSALHLLMNTLDGLSTPHGLVVFITTNYKERLDAALIRPGRIDHEIELGALGLTETIEMFVTFYGEKNRRKIQIYVDSPRFKPRTGAELQTIFMEAKEPEDAITLLMKGTANPKHEVVQFPGGKNAD